MPLKVSTDRVVEPTMVAAGEEIATVGAARFSGPPAGAARLRGRRLRKERRSFIIAIALVFS